MNSKDGEQGYKFSRLWLNRDLKELDKWDIATLEKRFETISKRFLEIWKIPEITVVTNGDDEINIFDAESPKDKKMEYFTFFNEKVQVKTISELFTEIFKKLFDLQPDTFFTSELAAKTGLTNNPTDLLPRQRVKISENYCIEGNLDSVTKFDKIKLALTIFGFEDELFIKYSK